MSLMKTLTKVAMGIAVAKGLQHVTSGAAGRRGSGGSGLGEMFQDIVGAGRGRTTTGQTTGQQAGQGGGLGDLLGSLAGNGTNRNRTTAPSSGGLGDLLGGLTGALGGALGGGAKSGAAGGGIGDLLGKVLGGGALAGALGGAAIPASAEQLTPMQQSEIEDEAEAALMLKAMIMAVKADGTLDAQEKARVMEAAGDATPAEIDFINAELAAPVDIDALLRDVPRGMEEKVYLASLMAIDLDQPAETAYLQRLARALGLQADEVNALHDHLNAKRIYS